MGWVQHAACSGAPSEPFFDPVQFRDVVRMYCQGCPVAFECHEDALKTADWMSVRGGQTPEERVPEARRRGLPVDEQPVSDRNVPKPCGTFAAFRRHRRYGEEPCVPCRVAYRAENRRRNAMYRPDRRRGAA